MEIARYMTFMRKTMVVVALVALAACSTERLNLKLDDAVSKEKVSQIRKGATTKSQVESIFGEPIDRLILPDGESFFYKDFNLRTLHVEFDKNGVVKDYVYNY